MIQETIDFDKKIDKKTIKESIMILWNRMPGYHEFNVYKFIQEARENYTWASEGSYMRFLRMLRQEDKIKYVIIDERKGAYRKL